MFTTSTELTKQVRRVFFSWTFTPSDLLFQPEKLPSFGHYNKCKFKLLKHWRHFLEPEVAAHLALCVITAMQFTIILDFIALWISSLRGIIMRVCSRFDLEQNQAQAEVQRERSQREKLAREKDLMTGEMFNLRQQLQVSHFTLNDTLQTCLNVLSQGLLRDVLSQGLSALYLT